MSDKTEAVDKEQAKAVEEVNRMREMAQKMPGKTIALSDDAAFYVDENEQFVLNAYGNREDKKTEFSSDRVVVQKGWKLYPVMRAIRAGLLRVFNEKGVDVTNEFGGAPASVISRRRTPIVEEMSVRANPEDSRDKKLMDLLNDTADDVVLSNIASRKMAYETLERLLQLEKDGNNPQFRPRQKVVDGIVELIRNTSGIMIQKLEEEGPKAAAKK